MLLATITIEMQADGHDQIIPISENGILAIQIGLVMGAIGLIFLFAALLRRLVRRRNLPEPRSYMLIVLATLLLACFWEWVADEKNLVADIADLAVTPVTVLILLFAPMLLYRISPKRKAAESQKLPNKGQFK